MGWKTAHRSFYYQGAPEPADLCLPGNETAMLSIDVQNIYMEIPDDAREQARWAPFHKRMREIVIPTTRSLQHDFRKSGIDVIHARIACQLQDGRDRSLSQKKPGWNYLLLPKDESASQIVPELSPASGEIVLTKTTDSALTGTNLRLILSNMGIKNLVLTGIFTDQCVSSTVRSLADESFNVIVLEDCCAAGTEELHLRELEIINMIYCHVLSSWELREIMGLTPAVHQSSA
ncbi:MAG: cysteine hydrolase [Gammaproteobacteria bacterium]|nr:cysteine hydrolase [Gammaproteobacteria bacterium]MCP5406647.1 cysteine hydrolase [Chromatiaceae bacterium]MCP5444375.1 cysteine hydrolase [Chromatiaceae bacterium]